MFCFLTYNIYFAIQRTILIQMTISSCYSKPPNCTLLLMHSVNFLLKFLVSNCHPLFSLEKCASSSLSLIPSYFAWIPLHSSSFFFFFFIYSHVHTLFGSFLLPAPLPPYSPFPLSSRQVLVLSLSLILLKK
jgi:hypothetical protein